MLIIRTISRSSLAARVSSAALTVCAASCSNAPDTSTPWSGIKGAEDESAALPPALEQLPPTSDIYGGTPVKSCGWPTTVSMGGSCTGTLVHPELVIYAEHCGTNYPEVRFGEHIRNGSGFSVATTECQAYPGGAPGRGTDIAFCRLAEPVTNIPIVPPLMGCETDFLVERAEVTLVGFGYAEDRSYGTKREVSTVLLGITDNNEAVIGENGRDTCQGDSGGPVYIQLPDGSWRAFGITSYGEGCEGGGYYSMMHIGMEWIESASGLDVTPCTDAQGNWDPNADCGGFPLEPMVGASGWDTQCSGGPMSGAAETCGPASTQPPNPDPSDPDPVEPQPGEPDDTGDDDDSPSPQPEEMPDCGGCEEYSGTLAGTFDRDFHPGPSFVEMEAGTHIGVLRGPTGADFDLYLVRWGAGGLQVVAEGTRTSANEAVRYEGEAGYYAWIVESYAGAGEYTLAIQVP